MLGRAISGFDALGENANAVDLIMESLDFAPDTKYLTIDEGFEAVPSRRDSKQQEARSSSASG